MLRNQNLKPIKSGDSKTITVTVRDGSGSLQNLTGCTVSFKLAARKGSGYTGDALITKTTSDGITLTDPTNGVMTVTISATDTADLDGQYYYEIQVTDTSSNVGTVTTGFVKIEKDLIE